MIIKIVIFFLNLIIAQDSLFWFDMSKVRDPVPLGPKILDAIYGKSQITEFDSLKNIRASSNIF